MLKYPDCVVLTELGNFYEMYFEHAQEFAPLLGLKLAKKPTKRNKEGFVYMAGFPLHQRERYLKVLVNDLGKHVAISQEIRNDDSAKIKNNGNMFDRRVTRIITPGTLIDEKFIDPWANNFLLSIHAEPEGDNVGLAWVDLSCGDFFVQTTKLNALASALARIAPREVLLDQQFDGLKDSVLMNIMQQGQYSITYTAPLRAEGKSEQWLSNLDETNPHAASQQLSGCEVAAAQLLLHYIDETQLEKEGVQLQAPLRRQEDEYLMIDKHSLRALEVTSTLRDGAFKGSLLQIVRRTTTQSGARLLAQRLKAPSMSLEEINERLDLVQEMIDYPALKEDIVTLLGDASDALRLVSRFAFGRGEPDDLIGLAETINITARIASLLEQQLVAQSTSAARRSTVTGRNYHIEQLLRNVSLEQPQALAKRVLETIDEERLDQLQRIKDQESGRYLALADEALEAAGKAKLQGAPKTVQKAAAIPPQRDAVPPSDLWIMRRTASPRLTELHKQLDGAFEEKDKLEAKWQKETGAKKLTLKWMQPHGHVVHIAGTKDKNLDFSILGHTTPASSGTSTRSFFHQDWTTLGNKMEKIKEMIRKEEERVFHTLRKQVVKNIVKLRNNAAVLDELDVACGFATLAIEKAWVRPLLNNGTEHHIRGGRHPTVEAGLHEQGKQFTNNDCVVGGKSRILLITGPNMGGKSTFLRQNALLSILAQTGSYVPAEYAEIGLVDKIFSRVGSADNLYQDQSTFMVEMLETAEILKQATPKSFVIMDEVGRGTTPEDGIAVGFASLSHLYHVNQSRALFATHFHALADMTKDFEQLSCYCTDVLEAQGGSFSYVHKLRKGINRNPHALKVARLAGECSVSWQYCLNKCCANATKGMPEEAIAVAAKVLEQMNVHKPTPEEHTTVGIDVKPRKAASG
jgi:DNA mismatch repair ATPase MutS